jgi:hypothetical protein
VKKLAVALTVLLSALAIAQPAKPDGRQAFGVVARVLQSPRCLNCHPSGDRPLQTDQAKPHAMNISRATVAAGVPCSTCHQERNSEAIGVAGGPPGAPHWGLPAADMPLVFQGKSATQLCEQLKDPARNGRKTLAQLVEHVSHDPLVLWGWQPGGKRSLPPVPHAQFVTAFTTWVNAGAPCP